MGFDGSRRRARGVTDATALIGYSLTDETLFPIGLWEQPEGPEGDEWQVPELEVDAEVRAAFKTYKVVGFFADPALWSGTIVKWEADFGSKLRVKGTRDHPIYWWMNRTSLVVRATEQLHTKVSQGQIRITGPTLVRHFRNARRRAGNSGVQIAKAFPDSPDKIDGAAASILAVEAAMQAVAAGVNSKKKSTRLVYS